MNKFLKLLNQRKGDLARAIATKQGKTFTDAHGEVERRIDIGEFDCGIQPLFIDSVNEGWCPLAKISTTFQSAAEVLKTSAASRLIGCVSESSRQSRLP